MTSWTHEKVNCHCLFSRNEKKTLKTQRDVCSTQDLNISWDGSEKRVFFAERGSLNLRVVGFSGYQKNNTYTYYTYIYIYSPTGGFLQRWVTIVESVKKAHQVNTSKASTTITTSPSTVIKLCVFCTFIFVVNEHLHRHQCIIHYKNMCFIHQFITNSSIHQFWANYSHVQTWIILRVCFGDFFPDPFKSTSCCPDSSFIGTPFNWILTESQSITRHLSLRDMPGNHPRWHSQHMSLEKQKLIPQSGPLLAG